MKGKQFLLSIGMIFLILLGLVSCRGFEPAAGAAAPAVDKAADSQPELPAVSHSSAQAAVDGTLEQIYSQVNPSVVHIQVVQMNSASGSTPSFPQLPGFPNLPDQPQLNTPTRGEGSGFVWDKEGHIITNNHVIESADDITVVFADGRMIDATLVGADRDSDLAVLKVDLPAEQLQPVSLADSTGLHVGELAVAIGNPFGQEGTMTVGIISALGRLLPVESADVNAPRYNIPDVIQTDAAINPGNSGGVLLNDKGEVVGVTSAIMSAVRSSSGVGFAIPAAIVQQVVPVLIAEGHYEHPYVGISGTTLTPDQAAAMDLPVDQRGALVVEVVAGSPAEKAGLQGSEQQAEINGEQVSVGGDVIIAADGRTINSMDDLITDLSRYAQVNQSYSLTVLRDGREKVIDLTLAARPGTEAENSSAESVESTGGDAYLGIAGMNVTPEIASAMSLPEGQEGVLVTQVEPQSPADSAGLRGSYKPLDSQGQQILVGGDMITAVAGSQVKDMQSLKAILSQARPGDKVNLNIIRDGSEMTVRVELGQRDK